MNKGAEPQTVKQCALHTAAASLVRESGVLHGVRANAGFDVPLEDSVCLDGVPGNLQVDAAAPSRYVPQCGQRDSALCETDLLLTMSENLASSAVVPESDRLLEVSESLTVPGVSGGHSAWRSKVRVGAPSRACVGLAQVDRRAAASGRDLLALCDSGAEHASGVEGAPSPFCAGLAEAGSRNQRSVVRHSDRSFDSFLSSRCVDSRRSCCVEFARVSHCTNSCLGTHAARANSRGLHSARGNSGGHINSYRCT